MGEAELRISKMVTGYGSFAISNVDFTLRGGEIFGLLGRSGSGKSTILKTLLGLLKPKQGEIRFTVDGKEEVLQAHTGYAPQENALYPFLSIKENLETFGRLYGLKKKEIEQRSKELLRRLDLTRHRNRRIAQLSGGMEKRADLAVALIHNPRLIILDEPFNGLDISLQRFIWKLLKDLAKEGCIIIITSHLLEDAQRFCTRFGLVERGNFYGTEYLMNVIKQQKGSLQQFLEHLFEKDLLSEEGE